MRLWYDEHVSILVQKEAILYLQRILVGYSLNHWIKMSI